MGLEFLGCAVCATDTSGLWSSLVAFADNLWPVCSERCFQTTVAQKALDGWVTHKVPIPKRLFRLAQGLDADAYRVFSNGEERGIALLYVR